MGLMNARNVSSWILKNVERLQEGYVIRVENHKNDRWIEIKKINDKFLLKEVGYANRTIEMDSKALSSSLNSILDYEFPRSHMLRVKTRTDRNNDWKILGR